MDRDDVQVSHNRHVIHRRCRRLEARRAKALRLTRHGSWRRQRVVTLCSTVRTLLLGDHVLLLRSNAALIFNSQGEWKANQ